MIYLRARYYVPGMGRLITRDTWPGDINLPISLNPWIYAAGNPINLIDPSGHNWQQPNALEGTIIHTMIESDFMDWGLKTGRNVDTEVRIQAASKQQTDLIKLPTGFIRRPVPDVDDLIDGRADLLEFSALQSYVYEIKHINSGSVAIADATWYQYHLNRDDDLRIFAPWVLGFQYLTEYGAAGKYIGFWPNDPNHVVMAKLYANGAIVYWGKDASKVQEPSFESADEYARYLAYLAALAAIGATAGNELGKRRQPVPAPLQDFFDWLCQPVFLIEPLFNTEPITLPNLTP